jgi:hypothetical protein
VTNQGQTTDELEEFGRVRYARLVGALVLCGSDEQSAVRLVESTMQRAVSGGLVGGREMPRLLEDEVLDRARPPSAAKVATDDVERAVAALAWPDRLATVASVVLANPRLGPGRPDEVARVLGAQLAGGNGNDPFRPSLATLLTQAVDRRGVAPHPNLFVRVRRTARFRWLSLAAGALAALAVLAVIVGLALRTGRDENGAGNGATGGGNRQWVAVLDVGPTSFALAPRAAEVGRVVGVYVFTNRWDCYDAIPPDAVRARGDWILGIAAPSKELLDELVTKLGQPVIVEVDTHDTCGRGRTSSTSARTTVVTS